MTTTHNGGTERMLRFIREHEFATRRDLYEETGVKASNIDKLLARHINAGMVIEEKFATDSRFPPVIRYRWNPAAVPGTPPRAYRPGAQPRMCLGGCAREFFSAGPMNRICDSCRTRISNASPYAP